MTARARTVLRGHAARVEIEIPPSFAREQLDVHICLGLVDVIAGACWLVFACGSCWRVAARYETSLFPEPLQG